jgi:hypothetical protein
LPNFATRSRRQTFSTGAAPRLCVTHQAVDRVPLEGGYGIKIPQPFNAPTPPRERSPRDEAAENRHASHWKQTIAPENGAGLDRFGRRPRRHAPRRSTPRPPRSEHAAPAPANR